MPKVTEQMYRDEVQTYILCFPNGNMAAIRREAFVEAVGQVIARQDEIAANYRKFFENL